MIDAKIMAIFVVSLKKKNENIKEVYKNKRFKFKC